MMEIDLQTRIGSLLEEYPALEQTLLEMSPAFAKLRNPVLRRTVARVATVQQAAKIAGIPPASLVVALRSAAGLGVSEAADTCGVCGDGAQPEPRPEWCSESKITVRFDAGPIIDAGQSPLAEIVRLAGGLPENGVLELTAPFRPEPVMDLLRSKGFEVWYGGGRAYFRASPR